MTAAGSSLYADVFRRTLGGIVAKLSASSEYNYLHPAYDAVCERVIH